MCGARRHTQIHGIDQGFTIGEGMFRQQVRQAGRGFHQDLALPRNGRQPKRVSANGVSAQRRPLNVGRWTKGSDKGISFPEASRPNPALRPKILYIIFVSG